MPDLLHDLISWSASANPQAEALAYQAHSLTYETLADRVSRAGAAYLGHGLRRADRVAVYLEKRFETVIALFGAAAAGGV